MDAFPAVASFLRAQAGYFPEVEDHLAVACDVYQGTGLPDCPKAFLTALLHEDDVYDMRQCSLEQMEDDDHGAYLVIKKFLKDAQAAAMQVSRHPLPRQVRLPGRAACRADRSPCTPLPPRSG